MYDAEYLNTEVISSIPALRLLLPNLAIKPTGQILSLKLLELSGQHTGS